ncbi:MAG: Rab family GTPase [Candidatus Hodarchaeota archaeon]
MPDQMVRDEDIQVFHAEGITFKVIIVGDAEVGKTSIVHSHIKKKFDSSYHTTVGVNIAKESFTWGDLKVSLLIWDIAGQVQFYMLHKAYFNGASGIFYVFDLTRPNTLATIKQNWYKACVDYGVANVPSLLIGNKSDLKAKVIKPAALNMAKTLGGLPYFETSAKTGHNVEEVFQKLVEMLLTANKLV